MPLKAVNSALQDLGYANGWTKKVPAIVIECENAGHLTLQETVGRCLTKVTCKICGYTYNVDSGD